MLVFLSVLLGPSLIIINLVQLVSLSVALTAELVLLFCYFDAQQQCKYPSNISSWRASQILINYGAMFR